MGILIQTIKMGAHLHSLISKFSILTTLTAFYFRTTHSFQIIAHRGASGIYPTHTVEAYREGAKFADLIECDLALTKDLRLVCLHYSWINATTNVHKVFGESRSETRVWGGGRKTDYFTMDFSLDELKTLGKVQERDYRDQSFNEKFEIASFQEYLNVAVEFGVGVYPETKEPNDFNKWIQEELGLNTSYEEILMNEIWENQNFIDSNLECWFQSFDRNSAKKLAEISTYLNSKFVYLQSTIPSSKIVDDLVSSNVTYLGVNKDHVLKKDSFNRIKSNLNDELVNLKENHGVKGVHLYTFRNEDQFIPFDFKQDYRKEVEFYLENVTAVDGAFCDFAESVRGILDGYFPVDDVTTLGTSTFGETTTESEIETSSLESTTFRANTTVPVTDPVTTEQVTTKPVTTKPVTTKQATTEPVTTEFDVISSGSVYGFRQILFGVSFIVLSVF